MDQLEKYKKGLLSEEELGVFTDNFMRAKYDHDRKNRWEDELAAKHSLDRNQPSERSNTARRIYLWTSAAAAAVVIGLLVWFGNPLAESTVSYEQLADNFLQEEFYENREIDKSDQDVEQLKLQAIFAYNQKDFTAAIEYYEAVVAGSAATDEHHFFLGLSYLYSDQPTAAVPNLLKVVEWNTAGKFREDARWFLALAYLKTQNIVSGKATLRAITPGMWNYPKAQQLLKMLE